MKWMSKQKDSEHFYNLAYCFDALRPERLSSYYDVFLSILSAFMRRQYHNIIDPHHVQYWVDWIGLQSRSVATNSIACKCPLFFHSLASRFFSSFYSLSLVAFCCSPYERTTMARCSSILSNLRVIIIIILWQYFTQTQPNAELNWYRSELACLNGQIHWITNVVNGRRDETYYRIMNVHTTHTHTWICSHAFWLWYMSSRGI